MTTHRRWRQRVTALAAACALLPHAAHALVTFDLTDLGSFNPLGAGVGASVATGINNDGVIVGNFFDGSAGNPALPWYLPTATGGATWRNLITLRKKVPQENQFLPAEAVGISNLGRIVGNGTLPDGTVHPISWSINGSGYTDVPFVFDALPPGSACGSGCEPFKLPYLNVAVNNQQVLMVNTLDQSRALWNFSAPATVWAPTQAYINVPAPVALNDAGTRVGSPFTGLNNVGQRVGMTAGGSPFLAWEVPSPLGGATTTDQIDLNSRLSAGSTTSLSRVTAINDLGQIVGQASNGQAVLATPTGSVGFVLQPGPFGTSARWDTPLGMLPMKLLAFTIAPVGGGFINSSGPDDPIGQLDGKTIERLTLGHPLSIPGPGGPGNPGGPGPGSGFYDITLPINLTVKDKVVVGADVRLSLGVGSTIAATEGLDNQGHITATAARITGRFDNQPNAGLQVTGDLLQVNGDLRNSFCAAGVCVGIPAQVLVTDQGRLSVSGDVLNIGQVRIDAGASLAARSFTQRDGQLTVDGTLDTFGGNVVLSGGSLNGNGTINAGVLLADGSRDGHFQVGGGTGVAFFRPGHSPGHFTVNGQLVIAEHGELELQVERLADGSLAWDEVSASRMQFLPGSTVHIVIGAGVAADQLAPLTFLACGSGCDFASGTQFVVDGAAGVQVQFGAGGLALAPVPEPGSTALLLAGLLLLRQRAHRTGAR
jgi:hypothetical protein